ncbi:MAG: hypothetical protein U1E59_11820 [Amaricoccus sp.]
MRAGKTLTGLVLSAVLLVAPVCRAEIVNIPSGAGWETRRDPTPPPAPPTLGAFLGPAQNVCLDAGGPTPANCPLAAIPAGPATDFGYTLGGWGADLTPLLPTDPKWIWAPGITATSKPAEDQHYSFRSTFLLCGQPMDSEAWLSADNRAELLINGTPVLSNADNSVLRHALIPAALLHRIPGYNTIEIRAGNDANPPNCGTVQPGNTDGPYSCNPAGVVFNGRFVDALNPWPTCTATMPPATMIYRVGESEDIGVCPVGWTGRIFQTCLCSFDATGTVVGNWAPPVNTCAPPPPARRVCLDFDTIPATDFGAIAGQSPGDPAFSDQRVAVTVETLATPAPSAFGDVHVRPAAGVGSGNATRFRNASFRFDLSGLPFTPASLSFVFDYRGGFYSFATDTSPHPVTTADKILDRPVPSPLPPIGASSVSIAQVPSVSGGTHQAGTMTLSGGAPRWLEIGGQELWIDHLCASE